MSRSQKWRHEWSFFIGDSGRRSITASCVQGVHSCRKQRWLKFRKSLDLIAKLSCVVSSLAREISVDFGTCLNARKTNQEPLSMPVLGIGSALFTTYSK